MTDARNEGDPLDRLRDELDRWSAAGRALTLWWRDDDAVAATPALDRLLAIASRHRVPLALAVVPAGAEAGLAARLAVEPTLVLQHGFAHRNHAPPGGRAVECGGDRETATILAKFADGRRRLEALFGTRFLPVMVPPWNRIEDRVRDALADAGYDGFSAFGPRSGLAGSRPSEINAHLDLLRWKPGPHFAGRGKLAAAMTGDLEARRGRPDDGEPYGILTHHLVHDEESWLFLDALLARLTAHPAVRWADARALFARAA